MQNPAGNDCLNAAVRFTANNRGGTGKRAVRVISYRQNTRRFASEERIQNFTRRNWKLKNTLTHKLWRRVNIDRFSRSIAERLPVINPITHLTRIPLKRCKNSDEMTNVLIYYQRPPRSSQFEANAYNILFYTWFYKLQKNTVQPST